MTRLTDCIAPSFYPVHKAIKHGTKTHYWLKGGRGSTKSSFVACEIIMGIMQDENANAVCLRKVGLYLKDSVYEQLVRAICRVSGFSEPERIIQTWTRNRIQNDTETAQIATQSVGILSEQTILANHPWVEDVSAEVEQIKEEEVDAAKKETQYNFPARKQSEVKGGGPDAKKTEEE